MPASGAVRFQYYIAVSTVCVFVTKTTAAYSFGLALHTHALTAEPRSSRLSALSGVIVRLAFHLAH